MKKRRVLKKGKIIYTRKGEFVLKLADKLMKEIKPFCQRVKIAGSIRRHEKNPIDIDIVCIPKDKKKLENFLLLKGEKIQGGLHEATFKIKGVKVELYYTVPEEWGAELLAYSSEKGAEIGLRIIAKKKGFKLSQHGLFKGNSRVAGKTEKEIYSKLGRKWKTAERR